MTLFNDKVAVITGAARGLGRDYASFFAKDGARVVIADIDGDGAEKAAADLASESRRAFGVHLDITDETSVDNAVQAITGEFGGIDILVNNAGLWGDLELTSVLGTEVDYWRTVIDVNLTGAFIMSRAVAPVMRERSWGRIVNISSQGAWKPGGPYSVSKLALHSLAYGLAAELAPAGITVNSVAVGATFNEATQRLLSSRSVRAGAAGEPHQARGDQRGHVRRDSVPLQRRSFLCDGPGAESERRSVRAVLMGHDRPFQVVTISVERSCVDRCAVRAPTTRRALAAARTVRPIGEARLPPDAARLRRPRRRRCARLRRCGGSSARSACARQA